MMWLFRNPWTAKMGDEWEQTHSDLQWCVWFLFWIFVPAAVIVGTVLALCAI